MILFGYIILFLLFFISSIFSIAGAGYVLSNIFAIPMWIGSLGFMIFHVIFLLIGFCLMIRETKETKK